MTKEAIIIDKPSAGTLSLLKKLKECKNNAIEQMRSQRNLAIDISVR